MHTPAEMIRNIALIWVAVVASHCLASPMPDPDPIYKKTHVRIHVPYEVHNVHHYHIEKVPIIKEVPIFKEVPVFRKVEVIKHVPIIKTLPVPVVKHVEIEKPVFIPYKEHHGWH